MKFKYSILLILSGLILLGGEVPGFAQQASQTSRKPVVIPGKSFLPLQVMTRSSATIYAEPDRASRIVQEHAPAFRQYVVYTRPDIDILDTHPGGWYEIGTDNRGTLLGWIHAEDVVEWKHSLCLTFSSLLPPSQVLLFHDISTLQKLLLAPVQQRKERIQNSSHRIQSGETPFDSPITGIEPKTLPERTKQLYYMPILEHTPIRLDGQNANILKIATIVQGQTTKPDIVFEPLKADIVFVMDTSKGMQPYIDETLHAIKDISMSITKDSSLQTDIRFGLWGYRDSLDIPGIEYVTNNFTPELRRVSEFEGALASVQEASVGSKDYPEDVFAGMDKAMRESNWTPGALHIIVLLGDAPSHEPGHDWNSTGMNANTLRDFANPPDSFYIFALHIKDPAGEEYWDLTEEQFRTLSKNPGLETSSYWSVSSSDSDEFFQAIKTVSEGLVAMLAQAKSGMIASSSLTEKEIDKKTNFPAEMAAWVVDRDLSNSDLHPFSIHVLLNRKELNELKDVLSDTMIAGRRGLLASEEFLFTLQTASSVAIRRSDQLKNAHAIAEAGLLPEFLHDLPYKSQIMNLSLEIWNSWGVEQQEAYLEDIDAKLAVYQAILDTPEHWFQLYEDDAPDEEITLLGLDLLP